MKVALCYYGQPRTYKECIPEHQGTFWKLYDIKDVFAHTWFSTNHIGKKLNGGVWSEHHYEDINFCEEYVDRDLSILLQPKSIRFDEPLDPKIFGLNSIPKVNSVEWNDLSEQSQKDACLYAFFSMYTSIKRVSQLVEDYSNIYGKYDWIMLCRYDVVFKNPIWPDLSKFQKEGFFNWDSFFCFRPEAFFKWCGQIDWFFKYKDEARRCWVTNEQMQEEFCSQQMNIFDKDRFLEHSLDHYFNRGNGRLMK